MKTLLAESWRYANRCLWPLFFPIHYTILYMVMMTELFAFHQNYMIQVQSSDYILSPEFVSSYKKVDFEEACIMWRLIHHPTSATISDIMKLVFSSTNSNYRCRYYVNMSPASSSNTTSTTPPEAPELRKKTAYENIRAALQSRDKKSSTREPAVLTQSFEEFPELIEYNIDTSASVRLQDENEIPCPETVEEALFLVSKARQKSSTHPSFSADEIAKGVDYNGFDVYSIRHLRNT